MICLLMTTLHCILWQICAPILYVYQYCYRMRIPVATCWQLSILFLRSQQLDFNLFVPRTTLYSLSPIFCSWSGIWGQLSYNKAVPFVSALATTRAHPDDCMLHIVYHCNQHWCNNALLSQWIAHTDVCLGFTSFVRPSAWVNVLCLCMYIGLRIPSVNVSFVMPNICSNQFCL